MIRRLDAGIALVEKLDEDFGLLVGDIDREGLEKAKLVIEEILTLSDRDLKKLNAHFLRELLGS